MILSEYILFGMHGEKRDEFLRIETGILTEIENDRRVVCVHRTDAEIGEHDFEFKRIFEISGFDGGRAVSVDDFAKDIVELFGGFGVGESFVEEQSHLYIGDVIFVEVGGHGEVDFGFDGHGGCGALEGVDGFLHEFGVHVESDGGDVSALFGAEEVSATAHFEVEVGDFESGTEFGEAFDGVEAFARDGAEVVGSGEEVAIGAFGGTADAASDLVELGQAKAFGVRDDEAVCGGDVDAGFDDRRAEQEVCLVMDEAEHGFFEVFFVHLSVGDDDSGFGGQALDAFEVFWEFFDAVVQKIDLSAASEFLFDGLRDDGVGDFGDEGVDGEPVAGGRFDDGEIFESAQAHLESPWNWGGGHGEAVDAFGEGFDFFFVCDAETVFLVDDEEAQGFEDDVFGEESVCADEDVDFSDFEFGEDLFDLFGFSETVEGCDGDGMSIEAFEEVLVVLFGEDGGGDEDGDLFSVEDAAPGSRIQTCGRY